MPDLIDRMPRDGEDWEWVSMENYSKDTQELTEQASHIIGMQAKEIRDLRKLVSLLVHCAGKIEVPKVLYFGEALPMIREDRFDTDSIVYRRDDL